MAAILCDGIGKACNTVCCLPCKLCDCCCRGCNECCEATVRVWSNPFCFYVTVAVGLNVAPVVLGLWTGLGDDGIWNEPCRNVPLWMLVNAVLSIIHIAAAWYIAIKSSISTAADNAQLREMTSVVGRATHLMCYDPIVAIYILIYVGFVVWLMIGVTWTTGEDYECSEEAISWTWISITCGWIFLGCGFVALCISLCLGACCEAIGCGTSTRASASAAPPPVMAHQASTTATPTAVAVPVATAKTGTAAASDEELAAAKAAVRYGAVVQ